MAARIPFVAPLDDPGYGAAVEVAPGLRRIVAENPSKYTYRGTGTYVLGEGEVVVIDPGPELPAHRAALRAALSGEVVVAILVTHCHADHSPLATWLAAETGAPTVAFGPHAELGDPDDLAYGPEWDDLVDTDVADEREAASREAVDTDFVPDVQVADGEVAWRLRGATVRAVHTPGHTSNHLCYAVDEQRWLFTGDHVMGWSTTVVSPPDGDMRAYLESLRSVMGRHDDVLWPTHGNPVTEPGPFLEAYVAHRLHRERAVLDAVRDGCTTVRPVVDRLYVDVPRHLHRAAGRSVLAHLVKLVDDGLVAVEGPPAGRITIRSVFHPV